MGDQKEFEVLARCVMCDDPIRVREWKMMRNPGEEDPGFVTEHISYHGANICLACLGSFPLLIGLCSRFGLPDGMAQICMN